MRRSTAAACQHGGPLWKLSSLGSPRIYAIFMGAVTVPVFLAVVWFSSVSQPDSTQHNRLQICWKICLEMLGIPPWNPSLVPSDFHLFPALKERFSGHRLTCDGNVKDTAITWLHSGNLTLYLRDGQTYHSLWQICQPSKGSVENLLTNGTFILCFQLPLLNSCLWFIGTVNLITGPLSYYEGHGKRKMAKWLLISNPTGTFSRCKQTGKKYV